MYNLLYIRLRIPSVINAGKLVPIAGLILPYEGNYALIKNIGFTKFRMCAQFNLRFLILQNYVLRSEEFG